MRNNHKLRAARNTQSSPLRLSAFFLLPLSHVFVFLFASARFSPLPLFSSVDQLEHLSGYRDKLRELILTSNPLCQSFTSAPGAAPQSATQLDYSVYQQYLSSVFPALQRLDGQPLQSLIDFDLPLALSSNAPTQLPQLKDSFFDSEQHKAMCYAFVTRYFQLYDHDRQDRVLLSVYSDNALFSLTYQPDPRHSHVKYSESNRNILILGGPKARLVAEQNLLKVGPVAIVSALHALPASKHDRDSFVADVCQIPSANPQLGSLLHVTIRGHFVESGTDTTARAQADSNQRACTRQR